uniref:Pheromone binding protein 1 n=1 Tax=Argyresthia conjugella TaxID=687015 RepID=H9N4R7_9NEOP|nr:pheromone binding protein 1 [Argyresthia conjugella]
MAGFRPNWRLIAVFALILVLKLDRTSASQEVMKKLTAQFSTALDACKKELNIQDHILQDFYNFWREDYALVNREMGCVIMCMAVQLDLITEDLKMHHGKAHEFAKTHGADDELAKQLVSMIHECEKLHSGQGTDECATTLEIAKCFRSKIHDLKWAPSMEVVLEEVMTEM